MATRIAIARAGRTCCFRLQQQSRPSHIWSLRSRQQTVNRQYGRSFSVTAAVEEKKYTEEHEWVELSANQKTATIGISRYAAKALGDVVFVELPTLDDKVGANETIGAVESVKAASDINSPISGTVVDINKQLEEDPKLLNEDPEGEAGWIAKLEVQKEDMENEMANLMDAKAYSDFTEKAASEE